MSLLFFFILLRKLFGSFQSRNEQAVSSTTQSNIYFYIYLHQRGNRVSTLTYISKNFNIWVGPTSSQMLSHLYVVYTSVMVCLYLFLVERLSSRKRGGNPSISNEARNIKEMEFIAGGLAYIRGWQTIFV